MRYPRVGHLDSGDGLSATRKSLCKVAKLSSKVLNKLNRLAFDPTNK